MVLAGKVWNWGYILFGIEVGMFGFVLMVRIDEVEGIGFRVYLGEVGLEVCVLRLGRVLFMIVFS